MSSMEKGSKTSLSSSLLFLIVVGMLAISIYYLYNTAIAIIQGALEEALYYALLGFVGLGISVYVFYVIRKRRISKKPPSRVLTTIECKKCGFKNLRMFEKGDFIFKSLGNCKKCDEPMLVTAIYSEKRK